MSAPDKEPAQWVKCAAESIHPQYGTHWWVVSTKQDPRYRALFDNAESYRRELARKIEAASPVAELTAANAELLAGLREIAETNASKHGLMKDMLSRATGIARALIAKHALEGEK